MEMRLYPQTNFKHCHTNVYQNIKIKKVIETFSVDMFYLFVLLDAEQLHQPL